MHYVSTFVVVRCCEMNEQTNVLADRLVAAMALLPREARLDIAHRVMLACYADGERIPVLYRLISSSFILTTACF